MDEHGHDGHEPRNVCRCVTECALVEGVRKDLQRRRAGQNNGNVPTRGHFCQTNGPVADLQHLLKGGFQAHMHACGPCGWMLCWRCSKILRPRAFMKPSIRSIMTSTHQRAASCQDACKIVRPRAFMKPSIRSIMTSTHQRAASCQDACKIQISPLFLAQRPSSLQVASYSCKQSTRNPRRTASLREIQVTSPGCGNR